MLPLHYFKKAIFCMACLLIAACNGQNDHPTTPDTDAADVSIAVSDTVSTITVIDIIE